MNHFILRFGVMFLTFIFGLATNFLLDGLGSAVDRWIENPQPVLEEPCVTALAVQPKLIPGAINCDLLVITVDNSRRLSLRGLELGSLDDLRELQATLISIFAQRAACRAYRPGLDLNSDIPEDERIEKTVLIKAPRSLSYGEVSDLIAVIKATGASPIGLVTEGTGCSGAKALRY